MSYNNLEYSQIFYKHNNLGYFKMFYLYNNHLEYPKMSYNNLGYSKMSYNNSGYSKRFYSYNYWEYSKISYNNWEYSPMLYDILEYFKMSYNNRGYTNMFSTAWNIPIYFKYDLLIITDCLGLDHETLVRCVSFCVLMVVFLHVSPHTEVLKLKFPMRFL